MFDFDHFQEIWVTITRNKVRSILTGFGIFWGIFMLIIMLGAGRGLENGMMMGIDGFATNSCFFYSSTTSEPYQGFKKGRHWNIHNSDVEAIRKSVSELEYLSPMLWGDRNANNIAWNERAGTFSVRGIYPDYTKIEQQRMKLGRFINDIDIMQKRKVCVIGTRVFADLFAGQEDPLGKYIRVNGIYYMVIGVSSSVSNISIGGKAEDSVILPFTTLQQISNQGDIVHFLGATAKRGIEAEVLQEKIIQVLKNQNKISPTDKQAVGSFNIENQFKMFEYLFLGISSLIWIVGVMTLLAGAIGISNIMLVTVKERTKEIGVRRALGAKPIIILKQIIAESLLLTVMAGTLGLCLGVGFIEIVDTIFGLSTSTEHTFFAKPMVPFNLAIIALFILLICGLVAGAIPAWRALQIKAIDAIREE